MVSVWRESAGTVGREDARTRSLGESKSRNKVSVGEPAEGSLSVFRLVGFKTLTGFNLQSPDLERSLGLPSAGAVRMKRHQPRPARL